MTPPPSKTTPERTASPTPLSDEAALRMAAKDFREQITGGNVDAELIDEFIGLAQLMERTALRLEAAHTIDTDGLVAKVEAMRSELIELVKSDQALELEMAKIQREPYAIGYSDAMGKARVTELHKVESILKLLAEASETTAEGT